MQHQLHNTYIDLPRRGFEPRILAARHRRRPRTGAIRIHQKIVAGLVLLVLLLAYDVALRIDEHVTFVTPQRSAPLAFDDSAVAMHRF
jgi:hypothetical protein